MIPKHHRKAPFQFLDHLEALPVFDILIPFFLFIYYNVREANFFFKYVLEGFEKVLQLWSWLFLENFFFKQLDLRLCELVDRIEHWLHGTPKSLLSSTKRISSQVAGGLREKVQQAMKSNSGTMEESHEQQEEPLRKRKQQYQSQPSSGPAKQQQQQQHPRAEKGWWSPERLHGLETRLGALESNWLKMSEGERGRPVFDYLKNVESRLNEAENNLGLRLKYLEEQLSHIKELERKLNERLLEEPLETQVHNLVTKDVEKSLAEILKVNESKTSAAIIKGGREENLDFREQIRNALLNRLGTSLQLESSSS
jgi:hypothetical protein